jgi:exodeoxyribonuclease V alpha subunit
LSGRWVQDRKYGEQFRSTGFVTIQPSTLVGIEKYLGSGMVRGIGPVMARRLVERFGLATLEIIESEPERLAEVEGIGPVRRNRIQEAWVEQREIKEVMVFLQSHGVTASYAGRIYKEYGARAIGVVRENPYRLATDIHGIGFLTADRIAARLGVPRDSPLRAEAGVLHVLGRMSDEGHVYAPASRLVEEAREILDLEATLVEEAVDRLARQGAVVCEALPAGERAVYGAALHAAESGLAAAVRHLVAAPSRSVAVDAERALAWFEKKQSLTLAPRQREAVTGALHRKALVITGGPGTGKTTLVNAVIRILEAKGVRILLCAPTGRAAKRMTETTSREARTLHRLLEFNPRSGQFERNGERLLEADLIIVDEVSMVDLPLAHHLLRAIPATCRLVLVGDVDQLPSVGPGNVLGDLIRSESVDVVRLTEIFRQAEESRIVVNAHRVNRGEMPILAGSGVESDFFFIERDEPESIVETVKSLLRERIPARFRLDPVDDIQVLTPMNRGLLGAGRLNTELQALLNPEGPSLKRGGRVFRVGDKVMQIRNNYDLEVFNGDIGRVTGLDEEGGELEVTFDGGPLAYAAGQMDELVHAYACSIHKAQGSEYPCVIIPFHTQHYVMLRRNLLYTGITRGRRLVIVVGSKRALALAVRNDRVELRYTRLTDRLQGAAG